ncbi:T9SS type A sorting domain-containing protein [Lacibacter luteus]|uniref:T9SS type A sorting domain-containing protein n=1 Tax=Lacibacter luteus TaxID=2508719 RepID=A0A4Q1CHD1_9BACT|nr:T9SS type A sorting domain-containing protein [Lacibacter luteus]RXK59311.1 T9SS type A sorting domain-containing protein [Lacibacter luteus]
MKLHLYPMFFRTAMLALLLAAYPFTIIFAQNECTSAQALVSSTGCNNTNINLSSATASSGIPAGCEAAGTYNDYWYSFTAQSTSHTITLSNIGTRITAPRIQLYSGSCGSLTSVACSSSPHTSLTQTGLTVGATYYLRISQYGAFGGAGNYKLDLCITHPIAPPANDECASSVLLTSGIACTNVTGNLFYATASSGVTTTCGSGSLYDVWYRFQATASTHAVTLSNRGASLTTSNTYIQVLSGSCGTYTSLACGTAASRLNVTGLTAGTFYYVRVYTSASPTVIPSTAWNFDICVQNGPANDECSGAVTLTPGAACTNTAGTLDLATANAATPTATCTGTMYDVWYRFTATSTTHNINVNSLGSNIASPRVHVYTGACGSLVQFGCASSSTYSSTLFVAGVTYYIRVSNAATDPSGTGGVAVFNICVTNSTTAAPANDACSTPQSLTSSTVCNPVSGTLFNATASTGAQITSTCGNNASASDVWYSFVAQTAYPSIVFNNIGIPAANGGGGSGNRAIVQLLSASSLCTNAYTSMSCTLLTSTGSSTITTSALNSGAGLTVGQTYYIRVFYNQSGTPANTWTFTLCVQDAASSSVTIETSKSYTNVTKSNGGGSIDVGDILEIRSTLYLSAGTIDSLSFQDTLKAGAGLTYQSGTVALRTNEGKIYPIGASAYTDATGDDAGHATGTGAASDANIRIFMGASPTSARGGTAIYNTTLPKGSGFHLVMATYRVQVTGVEGTRINFGGGSFRYRNQSTGSFVEVVFPRDSLIVYASPSVCPNAVSATNVIGDEYNGTFGTATGTNQTNRNASANTKYTFVNFSASAPQDNYYGITNNTASSGTVVTQTYQKQSSIPQRVFNVWDISGDHTGAADQNKGNPPCNSSLPVSATNPCGYMMVVNSSYRTDTAFQFNVANACPNTYYEVSAWFKNVCYKCGADYDGTGSFYGGGDNIYLATGTGDSSGVKPNVAIKVNNLDYYSTGDLQYQGLGGTQTGSDTLNNWVKRAFVYKTDSVTTSFTLTLRNNAPGAGGNDWAIDDISFKTCSPSMQMTPNASQTFCDNGQVDMRVYVESYYNMYQYYQWERSTDGGNTWSAAPLVSGAQSFSYTNMGSTYRDTVSYPSIVANSASNGHRYRIRVATTQSGLSNSCAVFNTDDVIMVNLASSGCAVLPAEMLKFNVDLNGDKSVLTWKTKNESLKGYEVERSNDGVHFSYIGFVNAKGIGVNETAYLFNDPVSVAGKVYYRLKMVSFATESNKYSNTLSVVVDPAHQLEITNLVNPFVSKVSFQLNASLAEVVELQLTDALGHPVVNKKITVNKGANAVSFDIPQNLARGSYLLRVMSASGAVHRIIQKL